MVGKGRPPRTTFNIPLAQDVAMNRAMKGVRGATLEAQRILQVDVLSSDPPRTGRLYRRGKDLFHQASAPGESPAPDTGQLRAGSSVAFLRDKTVAKGQVIVNGEKAANLELGTEKIAARPFMSRLISGEFRQRIISTFYRFAKLG
jgi:hypothetical protein